VTGRDDVYDQAADPAWVGPCPVGEAPMSGLPADPYQRAGAVRAMFGGDR
jgi:hypothetical protein